MSNDQNTKLYERAAELLDELDGHPSGVQKHLEQAIERDDLNSINYWVTRLEGELSQEHFMNYDVVVRQAGMKPIMAANNLFNKAINDTLKRA